MDTLDSDPAGPGLAPSLGIVGGSLVTLQPRQDPEETKAYEVQQHVQGHTLHTHAVQGHPPHTHTHAVQTHTHIFPMMYSTLPAVFSL